MARHWKKVVGAVVAVVLVVMAATFIYVKFINDPPDKLTTKDLDAALGADTTTPPTAVATDPASSASDSSTTNPDATNPDTTNPDATNPDTTDPTPATDVAATGVDGNWNVTTASELRYRVKETLNGLDTEAVGSTNSITGSLTLTANSASAAEFTVDMTTFTSDESRRDAQFNGRIMQVDQFPTGVFTLTSPIDFGVVPSEGVEIAATATGDLTLHGVTKSVTFDLTAKLANGKIGVLGQIPVLFSDYNVESPSIATIVTEDNGLLEFVLVFEKA